MTYTRKTRDYWDIEQHTAEGWEVVSSTTTLRDAKRELREYRENQPQYPVRAVKHRERIQDAAAQA